jgi:hypothetical protein
LKTLHTPDALTQERLAELASFQGRPCLSLYQPTHRQHPDNIQDPTRFRHLLAALETSLRPLYPADATRAWLAPFEALAQDRGFWSHTLDGLAVLGAPGVFRVFVLQRPVAALAVVADGFHTKPLRLLVQSAARYQVLALSRGRVQLYEGDRHALDPIALAPGALAALADALGPPPAGAHAAVSAHGDTSRSQVAVHHRQGGRPDAIDRDAARFFRAVDRAVREHHSRPSGLPLMLAALPEHHHLFRLVSQNPLLMPAGLVCDPQGLSPSDLCERAWQVAQPQHEARQVAWADAYGVAQAKGLGSANLDDVAHAAAVGRVASLLIEAERQVPGRIDGSTGRIDAAELNHPRVDDVLDDLGALVERMGGEVHVLPARRMPCRTGVAASFRH